MYNFKGEFVSKRKVDLRGKSQVESREQVLRKTRKEREKRRLQTLEHESAVQIQKSWRAFASLRVTKTQMRLHWARVYGSRGERVERSCLLPNSGCIPQLLLSLNPSIKEDVERLQALCHLILTSREPTGELVFCRHAQTHLDITQMRTARLLHECLKVLELNRTTFVDDLSLPLDAWNGGSGPWTILCMIDTLSDSSVWSGVLGLSTANSLSSHLVAALTASGLNHTLSSLVRLVCPISPEPGVVETPSSVESVACHLLRRQCLQSAESYPLMKCEQSPLQLLATSCLWSRCPSFRDIGGKLYRKYFFEGVYQRLPEIVKSLRHEHDTCADVALALVGNVVQLGGAALFGDSETSEERLSFCSTMACTLSGLVSRLSLIKLFNNSSMDNDEDDELDDVSGPSCDTDGDDWDPTSSPQHLVIAAQGLLERSGHSILEGLMHGILRHANPSRETTGQKLQGGAAAVCELLDLVLKAGNNFQRQNFLLYLALSGEFIQRAWYSLLRGSVDSLQQNSANSDGQCLREGLLPLDLFCRVYSCFLDVAGPEEVYSEQKPIPLTEIYDPSGRNSGLLDLLKHHLWEVLWLRDDSHSGSRLELKFQEEFQSVAGSLLGQLYDYNVQWKIAPCEAFHIPDRLLSRFKNEAPGFVSLMDDGDNPNYHSRSWKILNHAPCLIPFPDRAKVFSALVAHDRNAVNSRLAGRAARNSFVTINRNHILYDGFNQLNELGDKLKLRIKIQFIDEHGLVEAGVDGGGLFKDFMEELIGIGFDPQYGLFTATEDNQIYPNPAAQQLQPDALSILEFLGRMLGKAVYEGILIELPFAGFFLKKIHSLYCTINDLPTLDPEMYRNLMMLRSYPGAVDELSLNFTIADSSYGEIVEIELKPGGKNIPVTNKNKIEYIHRVADHRLNKQVREVCRAFLRGFYSLIRPKWVKMFNAAELQTLISGSDGGIDLADMQANVEYAGGYHENHPVIKMFWEAIECFSAEEQQSFLRFVTACSRAPLLGFEYLQPKMCIQMAGTMDDAECLARLPTSATCLNILKLPPYTSREMVHSKLLYSINSGARFDLS